MVCGSSHQKHIIRISSGTANSLLGFALLHILANNYHAIKWVLDFLGVLYNLKTFIFVTVVIISLIACAPNFSRGEDNNIMGTKPEHHTETGFQNHPFVETAAPKGILFYLRRFWGSIFTPSIPEGHSLSEQESVHLLNSIEGDRISWLGHATFLINISGKTILTDPFLSKFASPVSWAGPGRYVNPGISLENLPPIDIVIISHSHYDHLDDQTISSLKNKNGIKVVVPLGLSSFFAERGYKNITELDWWDSVIVGGIKLTSLPAVHDSARSTSDHNQTLWSSWAIESGESNLLFVGDSGYSNEIYSTIGKKFKSFDYAILPIGAYEPRKLMKMSHVTPEEAVLIGVDVKAKTLVASHWGTVSSLSDEPPFEPPIRFRKSALENGFLKNNLWIMKVGETKSMSQINKSNK
ncbi:MAG: N-acyl-phosphatidylethanolamine-hydrolyzing phospholipase D [Psychromonas sp.]|jgi:N-acyl-phosphatidylethanolamine-hydrolysing phospholipase D